MQRAVRTVSDDHTEIWHFLCQRCALRFLVQHVAGQMCGGITVRNIENDMLQDVLHKWFINLARLWHLRLEAIN